MPICVFRFCRAWLNLGDDRCPSCGRSQTSPAARAERERASEPREERQHG